MDDFDDMPSPALDCRPDRCALQGLGTRSEARLLLLRMVGSE